MSWYWHEIVDEDSARYATTPAVWVSYLIAAITGLGAIVSFYRGPIVGASAWELVDCGLFAVIGWRIAYLSRVWAVVGLSVYLMEALVSSIVHGLSADAIAPFIVTLVFLAAYINALRGTIAYHRYARSKSAQTSDPM